MKATKPSRKTAESAKKTKVTKKPKSAKPAKGTAAEHASGNTDPADAALLKRGEEAWHACSPALRVAAGMATPTSAGLTLWGGDGVPDAAAAWLRALAVPAATKIEYRQSVEECSQQHDVLDHFDGMAASPACAWLKILRRFQIASPTLGLLDRQASGPAFAVGSRTP